MICSARADIGVEDAQEFDGTTLFDQPACDFEGDAAAQGIADHSDVAAWLGCIDLPLDGHRGHLLHGIASREAPAQIWIANRNHPRHLAELSAKCGHARAIAHGAGQYDKTWENLVVETLPHRWLHRRDTRIMSSALISTVNASMLTSRPMRSSISMTQRRSFGDRRRPHASVRAASGAPRILVHTCCTILLASAIPYIVGAGAGEVDLLSRSSSFSLA